MFKKKSVIKKVKIKHWYCWIGTILKWHEDLTDVNKWPMYKIQLKLTDKYLF